MKKEFLHKLGYVIIALVAIIIVIGLFLVGGAIRYTKLVPKITPKENVTVAAGETLELLDIFDVQCNGTYQLELSVSDTTTKTLDFRVSEDAKTLFVGSGEGTITVSVRGYGEVAEPVSAINVITVTAP